jgi:hypothetical protein
MIVLSGVAFANWLRIASISAATSNFCSKRDVLAKPYGAMAHWLAWPTISSTGSRQLWLRTSNSQPSCIQRAISITSFHRGDVLWIVTSEGPDDLLLVGRQRVDRIVGQAEAERITGSQNLWKAEYHAMSDDPEDKANLDISRSARRLTFDGSVDRLPRGFTGRNLQTIRRLDEGSGAILERLWAQRHDAD